jgi:anion-transporting  ArsA/GET3 family ATPase
VATTQPTANRNEHAGQGLLARRLLFVLGKGGVGRSTVAAALGMLAARARQRAVVVEVSGRGDVPRLFGRRGEIGTEIQLAEGLWTLDVDPRVALEEYLRDQIPLRMLADAIGSNTAFGYVTAATPGLRELLTIGKVWELAQPQRRAPSASPYDLVVVDAPATGHGLALLEAPRTFASAAAVGPIARQGRRIAATLADRTLTALVAVATPERAAVDELLELRSALPGRLDAVLANAVAADRFSEQDGAALRSAHEQTALQAPARGALATAIAEYSRVREQRAQLVRLEASLELPFLGPAPISPGELELLADRLEALR